MNSNNTNFDMQNTSFAHKIMHKAKASGISLFLFDRNKRHTPISFLYSEGVSTAINKEYAADTYQYDPLIPHSTSLIRNCKTYTGVNYKGMKPEQELHVGFNERYWRVLGHGFCEVAASMHSLSSDMFIIVGILSNEPKKHLSIDSAIGDIESWIQQSGELLIESSIRNCYSHNTEVLAPSRTIKNLDRLTSRETQVVYELLQGNSNKQISHNLSLSEYTVENHLRRIYKKFGVRSRLSLLAIIHNA